MLRREDEHAIASVAVAIRVTDLMDMMLPNYEYQIQVTTYKQSVLKSRVLYSSLHILDKVGEIAPIHDNWIECRN